jgi:hypothetical protein
VEIKRVWRQVCECLSEAVAHPPGTVSQVLLEVLLIADLRSELNIHLALFRVLLGATATAARFPLSKHTGGCGATPTFSGWRVYLQLMWEVSLLPTPVALSSHSHFYKLSCSKVARWVLPLLPSLASLFIYSSMRDCPFPPLWHSGSSAVFVICLFFVSVVYSSVCFFLFFPWVGVSLSRGLC